MLEIKGLSFGYDRDRVFEDFDLSVPAGQVCLITGINGVGKSTLLRLIAGALKPDAGEILVDTGQGEDPRRMIGFISDVLSLYESQTVAQAVDLHRTVYGVKEFDDALLRHTKVRDNQKVSQLSTGQRAILHLSLIMSNKPDIFLIDEILHSIDAYLRRLFLETLIRLLSERKATVVMVNLNFHDIEHLVDRVILLKSGHIVVDEGIESLKAKVKKIVGPHPPESMDILSRLEFADYSEFYVYPYDPALAPQTGQEVIDLNLTEIVTAFIGGEYA